MSKSIHEIAAKARPALALAKAGFEVGLDQAKASCPPPCRNRLVRGVCPVCERAISFRLGEPRSCTPSVARPQPGFGTSLESAGLAGLLGFQPAAL